MKLFSRLSIRFAQLSLALCVPLFLLFAAPARAAAPNNVPGHSGAGGDFSEKNLKTVSGVLHMKKPGEKASDIATENKDGKDAPSDDDNCVGYLISPQETYKIQASGDKILKDLTDRDGKKVSLQGNLDEKALVIVVQKILEGVMPPAAMNNPRSAD